MVNFWLTISCRLGFSKLKLRKGQTSEHPIQDSWRWKGKCTMRLQTKQAVHQYSTDKWPKTYLRMYVYHSIVVGSTQNKWQSYKRANQSAYFFHWWLSRLRIYQGKKSSIEPILMLGRTTKTCWPIKMAEICWWMMISCPMWISFQAAFRAALRHLTPSTIKAMPSLLLVILGSLRTQFFRLGTQCLPDFIT